MTEINSGDDTKVGQRFNGTSNAKDEKHARQVGPGRRARPAGLGGLAMRAADEPLGL